MRAFLQQTAVLWIGLLFWSTVVTAVAGHSVSVIASVVALALLPLAITSYIVARPALLAVEMLAPPPHPSHGGPGSTAGSPPSAEQRGEVRANAG